MADPISLSLTLARALLDSLRKIENNKEDCDLLEKLTQRTHQILEEADMTLSNDPSVAVALEHVARALSEAKTAVDDCCNAPCIASMIYPQKQSKLLKQAAQSLENGLIHIPLASLKVTTDMQRDVAALRKQLRLAHFNETTTVAHQIRVMKDELERAFYQKSEDTEDIKNMVQDLVKEQMLSKGEIAKDLAALKKHALDAHVNKETQEEFELNQIIEALSESIQGANKPPSVVESLKVRLYCPISKTIMKDPVILTDSGITYERSCIEEWIRRGHCNDPFTNHELKEKQLVSNIAVKDLCQSFIEDSGEPSILVKKVKAVNQELQLNPGLLEGYGKVMLEDFTENLFLVLVLVPEQKLKGFAAYSQTSATGCPEGLVTGHGEWNRFTHDLSFEDSSFHYKGNVSFKIIGGRSIIIWEGNAYGYGKKSSEPNPFVLKLCRPPPLNIYSLRPGIIEMEGVIVGKKDECNSRLVLLLESNFSVRGWMLIDNKDSGKQTVGHILMGQWGTSGSFVFPLYFSPSGTPLNSARKPTNAIASFKLVGTVNEDNLPNFSGIMVTAMDNISTEDCPMPTASSNGTRNFNYRYFREVSSLMRQQCLSSLKLLEIPADTELTPGTYFIQTLLNLDGTWKNYYLLGYDNPGDHRFPRDQKGSVDLSGMWHNATNLEETFQEDHFACFWTIEKSRNYDGYTIKGGRTKNGNKGCVEKSLEIIPKVEFEKSTGEDCWYVGISSKVKEKSVWKLVNSHGGYKLCLSWTANPNLKDTVGYALSMPVIPRDIRDSASAYATVSMDPLHSTRIRFLNKSK